MPEECEQVKSVFVERGLRCLHHGGTVLFEWRDLLV